jgi:Leucine-rich repeat (LRR) protein
MLISLPDQISNLDQLEKLFLNQNKLETIPSSIGYALLEFNCDGVWWNKRIFIHELMLNLMLPLRRNLKRLGVLELRSNALGQLPTTLGKLASLTKLDFSFNRITEIPPDICLLTELSVRKSFALPEHLAISIF